MLTKRSRYYKLSEASFPDRQGVARQCKALRRFSEIDAQFLHTLDAGDRLDHLAYKYYGQSLHWWRICDANLDFASPLALLDKLPSVTIRFDLTTQCYPLPLAQLSRDLDALPGVVSVVKEVFSEELKTSIIDGPPLFTLANSLLSALSTAVMTQHLPLALDMALQAQGVTLTGGLRFSAPQANLWQIDVNYSEHIYRFWYVADIDVISVNTAALETALSLSITFNRNSIDQQSIADCIAAAGFVIAETQTQVRLGQGVLIPPKYIGKS